MHWTTWWIFLATETALCMTPGPGVMLVISQGLARGTSASIWSAFGIQSGNLFYYAISATGVGALLFASYRLFLVVTWFGAIYLVCLGIAAFFGKSAVLSVRPAGTESRSAKQMFLNGFALQAANPKAFLFFTALLPQFIDPAAHVLRQMIILAITGFAVEFVVLFGYGYFAGRMTALAHQPRFATLINRVSGSMLIAAGVGIAAVRR